MVHVTELSLSIKVFSKLGFDVNVTRETDGEERPLTQTLNLLCFRRNSKIVKVAAMSVTLGFHS